jgi:hypothetical protein
VPGGVDNSPKQPQNFGEFLAFHEAVALLAKLQPVEFPMVLAALEDEIRRATRR